MEIEVKARLKDREAVMKKLGDLGCVFSKPIIQEDMVWAKKKGTLEDFMSNDVFLRIRIQNSSKVILTAKKPKAKTGHESLVKHEYEVVVDSVEAARGILELMGLQEIVRTNKVREKAKYKDFEICIDKIDDLGAFIEIEKIGDSEAAKSIQNEMLSFLEELGVSSKDVVKKGYDILMLEKTL